MSAALAQTLLSDPRAAQLRRSERALLQHLARAARPDGGVRRSISPPELAVAIRYSPAAVQLARRRLRGRPAARTDRPLLPELIFCEPDPDLERRGRLLYRVTLEWPQD